MFPKTWHGIFVCLKLWNLGTLRLCNFETKKPRHFLFSFKGIPRPINIPILTPGPPLGGHQGPWGTLAGESNWSQWIGWGLMATTTWYPGINMCHIKVSYNATEWLLSPSKWHRSEIAGSWYVNLRNCLKPLCNESQTLEENSRAA